MIKVGLKGYGLVIVFIIYVLEKYNWKFNKEKILVIINYFWFLWKIKGKVNLLFV